MRPCVGQGQVATYIPALGRVPGSKFGMAVHTLGAEAFGIGDAAERFSIQSVSKVFTLTLALGYVDEALWSRVGREPSGNPFNSLVQLEYEHGIPRNPFINAGALVVVDVIIEHVAEPLATLRELMRELSGNAAVDYDAEVAASERAHGDRNAALAHFLKAHGNLKADVDTVLDVYFHQCALAMSCVDLARAVLFLANGGVAPGSGRAVVTARQAKRINSLMLTCGLYDAVGSFAYRVGLPAKSGVGGGIVALIPRVLGLCAWSPELDSTGSSLVGTQALELFTTKTAMSIF